jgi:outer membrane protein assembly factor BamB
MRALDAETGEERWARDLETNYIGGAAVVDGERVVVGTKRRDRGAVGWRTVIARAPATVVVRGHSC